MPVDYSKWDNLELSDDSDIEVHPNVDKRSFIRAKQSQIHQERQHRRHQIETLKYERQVNDGLEKRIGSLLSALRAHREEALGGTASAGEVAFRAVMADAAGLKPEDDRPPKPPADVHANVDQKDTTYTQMMAALLDQVNKALEEKTPKVEGAARYDAMIAEIEEHANKVADLQRQLVVKLGELESEEARKITSDGIHTGFDSSHVNKSKPAEGANTSGGGSSSATSGKPELLNPGYQSASSTSNANAVDDDSDDPTEPTPLARKFAAIAPNNHYDSRAFITANPQILTERQEEGILMLAFDAEMDGQQDTARRCVHQAKLLEYCRSLGRDGVALFFKRIETRDHKAHDLFYGDVQDTYVKIMTRVKEIKAQQAAGGTAAGEGVEQIQLHAVEPGTVINIRVPPADSADPEIAQARKIFDGFAPDMRKALESGSLDEVNEVLGRMKVDEAEALVSDFGEAGILSLEDEIIDATTEEGRAQLKDMGREDFVDERGVATDKPPAATQEKEEYGDPE
ncbi:hsp90 co-chaperone Cdc37 [Sporothrix eucalyptigena]|uniref:Hsp90 chaperone protein kinase-targeting subunit n=1 Tax=Sporothrix eucalyptigena TaxID=1812306 RepID=A0ABP0BFC9_9PEZI